MKIQKIRVKYGFVKHVGKYATERAEITLTADKEENEDVNGILDALYNKIKTKLGEWKSGK